MNIENHQMGYDSFDIATISQERCIIMVEISQKYVRVFTLSKCNKTRFLLRPFSQGNKYFKLVLHLIVKEHLLFHVIGLLCAS